MEKNKLHNIMPRSQTREFSIGEFRTYFNRREIVMDDIIENDITSGTSNKDYIDLVRSICDELVQKHMHPTKKTHLQARAE